MRTFKVVLLSLFLSLFLVGCQGDNSNSTASDSNSETPVITSIGELPIVVLPIQSTELIVNSQAVNIEVRVFDQANNPYTTGSVKIIYPNDVQTGRDVGYFTSSSVDVNSAGIANFSYIGPIDLNADKRPISFAFYHEDNPAQSEVFTFNLNPDTNQVILTDYTLVGSPESVVMGLEQTETLSYAVKDKSGNVIDDSAMSSMSVTLLNPALGLLLDSNGNSGKSLTSQNLNNISLNLQTNKISGLLPVKVHAEFQDVNGNTQILEHIFNVTVLSGPPTAISLSYAGTSQDETNAKFIESWVLTVTDKYNNRVNTNPSVSMGMLAGYAQSSDATDNSAGYLYYNPATATNAASGTISASGGSSGGASFSSTNSPFSNVDDVNQYLVTFGNAYTYDASGKWTIHTNAANLLDLVDDFNGSSVSGLGFAVGNNFRQDRCDFGNEWVGNVYPTNGSNIVSATGSMLISVEYDYYLVGKDVMLWTNLLGQSNGKTVKIGEAKKITLRGSGLISEVFYISSGFTGLKRIRVLIDKTVEYYKNANFSYTVSVVPDPLTSTTWVFVGDSMQNGIVSCNNNGVGYVDINITSTGGATISLKPVIVTNEF